MGLWRVRVHHSVILQTITMTLHRPAAQKCFKSDCGHGNLSLRVSLAVQKILNEGIVKDFSRHCLQIWPSNLIFHGDCLLVVWLVREAERSIFDWLTQATSLWGGQGVTPNQLMSFSLFSSVLAIVTGSVESSSNQENTFILCLDCVWMNESQTVLVVSATAHVWLLSRENMPPWQWICQDAHSCHSSLPQPHYLCMAPW